MTRYFVYGVRDGVRDGVYKLLGVVHAAQYDNPKFKGAIQKARDIYGPCDVCAAKSNYRVGNY